MTITQHPLTETDAAEMWNGSNDLTYWTDWTGLERDQMLATLRAAFDAGREHERAQATPADPRHDPRPWEPPGQDDPLNVGDEVKREEFSGGVTTIRRGIVARVDKDGDPVAAGDEFIGYRFRGTWHVRRRIPAPTPPAVEVEMPGEPRLLTHVVLSGGEKIAEATWTGAVLLYARHPLATSLVVAPADQIEQWTLDGTHARRAGVRADGEPQFVKEAAK